MTPARIKELRDYIIGNGTPRDWVPMESKELLGLLAMAEPRAKGTPRLHSGYEEITLPIDFEALSEAFRLAKWSWSGGRSTMTPERIAEAFGYLMRDNVKGAISSGGLMYDHRKKSPLIHKRLAAHYFPTKRLNGGASHFKLKHTMNTKYRKKPVIIEAFQMTHERRSDNSEWPSWMHQAWQKDMSEEGSLSCVDFPNSDGTDQLQIRTLEGMLLVGWGDYIIQGVKGELYPCKPDIFEATYEPVTE